MTNRWRVRRYRPGVWHVEKREWRVWIVRARHSTFAGAIARADDMARGRQSDYVLAGGRR